MVIPFVIIVLSENNNYSVLNLSNVFCLLPSNVYLLHL